jgi:hypothetical protein
MKRIITRVLLTVVLAASVPLPVLWFNPATAQDPGTPDAAQDPTAPKPLQDPGTPDAAQDPTASKPLQDPGSPNAAQDPTAPKSAGAGRPLAAPKDYGQNSNPDQRSPMGSIRSAGGSPMGSMAGGGAPKDYGQNSNTSLEAKHARDERTRKLLSDYSRTDDAKERERVLVGLTDVVSDQFDMRQEARERELKELEDHVRQLRVLHQRRAAEKNQIVRDRVRQLLRDVEGLGWSDDGRLEPSTSAAREGSADLPAVREGPSAARARRLD